MKKVRLPNFPAEPVSISPRATTILETVSGMIIIRSIRRNSSPGNLMYIITFSVDGSVDA